MVVNCFQISIFAVANTTLQECFYCVVLLWIAFKLVSLQLQTQRRKSKCNEIRVVNCFQISIFAVANTTTSITLFSAAALWIAFKLVSLQLQTQLCIEVVKQRFVVNCFQISIFAVANTTLFLPLPKAVKLWIAFKLVSLQLQTQLWLSC